MSIVLTQAHYKIALDEICAADSDLAAVVASYGPPPIWRRPAGFRTLLYLILEQQVSLASARATYAKLVARLGAKQDGVLRHHTVSADGIYRDTVVFSILSQEWPAVRQNLNLRLGRL